MSKQSKRQRIRAFIHRQKSNVFGLLAITAASAAMTVGAYWKQARRADLFFIITVLLVVLCCIQAIRMRSTFRTLRPFRGLRHKRPHQQSADVPAED